MAFYHRLGELPQKKHTAFYQKDGKTLYREELVSALGFSGTYVNKYHIHAPLQVSKIEEMRSDEVLEKVAWRDAPLKAYHFSTDQKKKGGDFFSARELLLYNANCRLSAAHVNKPADFFYRNVAHHEIIFIHHGSGDFLCEFGQMRFGPGDQIVIPRGTIYQMRFEAFAKNKIVIVESDTAFEIPKHYRNEDGQLLESAPYCERDLRQPEYLAPQNQKGEFPLLLKSGDRLFKYTLAHHPFDVVGWDGYLYPFIFNIKDYIPKVGKIHLPPPVHLVFNTQHFVYCNFVPRLFDFHPQAVPVPYFHHNIDSDEVLYYIEGDFMSRQGVSEGSVTLHPSCISHGPQPGKVEASLGAKETLEYALMIDTFSPFQVTTNVRDQEIPDYYKSWL